MQDGAEILAKQSAHVLFLAGGPPALQETNVAAPGRYHNSHVRRLFRVRNGDSWKRKGNNGMRLAILWRKYWHDQDNKIELYRQNRIIRSFGTWDSTSDAGNSDSPLNPPKNCIIHQKPTSNFSFISLNNITSLHYIEGLLKHQTFDKIQFLNYY